MIYSIKHLGGLDMLGAAGVAGGIGEGLLQLFSDPNFLKYLGGAGSKLSQGAPVGQALDPSSYISGQAEQEAIRQIMRGTSGNTPGGSIVGITPSGQKMLPSGGTTNLGSVLGAAIPTEEAVASPVTEAGVGTVSPPVIQDTPQAEGAGGVGDIMGLVQQLAGGMGGTQTPGAAPPPAPPPSMVSSGMGGNGVNMTPTPTPIGAAGPDSIGTMQTADGTTTTIKTPSQRNLDTFGTSVPLESQRAPGTRTTGAPVGGMLPLWKALLGM